MPKGLTWRISLIILFLLTSLLYLTPTLVPNLPSWWKGPFFPTEKINLGLDLQGGIHLVMEVEVQKAVEGQLDLISTDLEDTLNSKNLRFKKVSRLCGDRVAVVLFDKATADEVQTLLKDKYPRFQIQAPFDEGGFLNLQLRMGEKEIESIKDKSVQQALETIRNRIDQFGVSEPSIQREGTQNIVVQLPGITDPKRAIELIGRTARLEFKLVDESINPETATPGSIPEGDEILTERSVDPDTGAVSEIPYVLQKKTLITGDLLTDAQVQIESQYNRPYVGIEFN